MRKSLFCLLPMIALGLGGTARSQSPAVAPSLLPTRSTGQGDASGSAQQGDTSPSPAPSDWAPPDEFLPGSSSQDVESGMQTDGTAPEPTLEWRAPVDSSGTAAAAAADQLAPRVEVAGPGTPKWKVVTYISQKTTADDNIFISHSNKQSDVYFSIAPGFAAGWGDFRSALIQNATGFSDQYEQTHEPVNDPLNGDYAFLNYTATATHYLSHDSADAVDQDGGISAQWAFSKVVLGLNARVQTLSGPEIDLGMRTRRTIFTFDASAAYTVSDKTSFNFDAGGTVRDYATELSSSDWHGQLFMDYQLFPKTNIGAGVVAGLRELQSTPDQYYQQGLLHATYTATDRLSLHVSGGVEMDEASGAATRFNPVFGLGGTYNIDAQNTLSLDASRSTSSSAVTSGETGETTGVNVEVRHRIYSSLSFGLSLGYQHVDYYDQGLSTLVRTDNYYFARPSLAYGFAEWSDVELAYEYHYDASSQQSFDFAENILSLQFNFVF